MHRIFTDFNLANVGNEHRNRRNTMNFNRNHQSEPPQPNMKQQQSNNATAEKLVKSDKSLLWNGIYVAVNGRFVCLFAEMVCESGEIWLESCGFNA